MNLQNSADFEAALGQIFSAPAHVPRQERNTSHSELNAQRPSPSERERVSVVAEVIAELGLPSREPTGWFDAPTPLGPEPVPIEPYTSPYLVHAVELALPIRGFKTPDEVGDLASEVLRPYPGYSKPRCKRGQAKVLSEKEISCVLAYTDAYRGFNRLNRLSARAKVLASFRAGLRPCEIAGLTARTLRTATGELKDHIEVMPGTSKRSKGRIVPMHWQLREALEELFAVFPGAERIAYRHFPSGKLIYQDATVVSNWFANLYRDIGLKGAKGMSGRRTFATQLVINAYRVGGSIADVMKLLGHSTATTSLIYIEPTANMTSMVQLLGAASE